MVDENSPLDAVERARRNVRRAAASNDALLGLASTVGFVLADRNHDQARALQQAMAEHLRASGAGNEQGFNVLIQTIEGSIAAIEEVETRLNVERGLREKPTWQAVLKVLGAGARSSTEIANESGYSTAVTSRSVGALLAAGLVESVDHVAGEDRRARVYRLTPTGAERAVAAARGAQRSDSTRDALDGRTPDQVAKELVAALRPAKSQKAALHRKLLEAVAAVFHRPDANPFARTHVTVQTTEHPQRQTLVKADGLVIRETSSSSREDSSLVAARSPAPIRRPWTDSGHVR